MRVAVLKGGRSLERQVSLKSGARVEDALERRGHEPLPMDVGPDLVMRLRDERPDAAFIALHGADGEDGTVQELLELLRIPYTGSGPAACLRCWDKVMAKHAMQAAAIPTPEFASFSQSAFAALGARDALPALEERLHFPLVVKPARQGSALGVKFARTAGDVPAALLAAFSYDDRVLLERFVAGRDLAVSVIEEEGGLRALPVVEAIPDVDDFYDFEARYSIGRTRYACPAEIPAETAARAQELAVEVARVSGCRGFLRVDVMLDEDGGLHVLEANAVPGLTEMSLLPMAADAAGLGFDELVDRLLQLAVGGHAAPR